MCRRHLALVLALALAVVAPARADELGPADFSPQVRTLYRVAACGGDGALPSRLDAKAVTAHCKALAKQVQKYRRYWLEKAQPVLADIVPEGLPTRVVYPFGGGDLLAPLATFPNLTELTTLSLEPVGDPRGIDTLPSATVFARLRVFDGLLDTLFLATHSRTTNLGAISRGGLPGELVFALVALAIHDFEPVQLHYFRLAPDGSVRYVTDADVRAVDAATGRHAALQRRRLFANAELTFRKRGDEHAPLRTWRHIGANLDDRHLASDPSPLRHLEAKGRVTAMTKAASYLLWSRGFTRVRTYLVEHMEWMISDSTGLAPEHARAAGFVQDTWGRFGHSMFGGHRYDAQLRELFAANPRRPLPFAYGYVDTKYENHLIVTRRAPK